MSERTVLRQAFAADRPTALEAESHISRKTAWLAIVGTLVLVAAVAALMWSGVPGLEAESAEAAIFSVGAAVIWLATAAMFAGIARLTGKRGYVVLSAANACLGGAHLLAPLFAFGREDDNTFLGGDQGVAWLFALSRAAFVIGIGAASWLLFNDERTWRRPGLGHLPRNLAIAVVGGLLAASAVFALFAEHLPVLHTNTSLSALALVINGLIVCGILAAMAVTWHVLRVRPTIIHRWLLAALTIVLAASIVATRPEVSAAAYLGNLAFGLVAAGILLSLLITRVVQTRAAAAERTLIDIRTKTLSRLGTLDALERAHASNESAGVILLQLDNFAPINRRLGYQRGNEVLSLLANRLSRKANAGAVLGRVARDQFALVVPGDRIGPEQREMRRQANEFLSVLDEPIEVGEDAVQLRGSVGTTVASQPWPGAEEVIRQAALAATAARIDGSAAAQPYDETGLLGSSPQDVRSDLDQALQRDDFHLDYQPIVSAVSGQPVGAEALIRWERQGEATSAGYFVDFARASGQIVAIGHVVVKKLIDELPKIIAHCQDGFFVTVNVTLPELASEELTTAWIDGPLSVPGAAIILEVLDSAELRPDTPETHNLSRLVAAGAGIAIDEFGPGMEVFGDSPQPHPCMLKLDQHLLASEHRTDASGRDLLTASVALAKSIHCEVVAEGIEDEWGLAVVRGLGVAMLQGYHFGYPLNVDEFLEHLDSTDWTPIKAASSPAQ